MKHFQIIEEIKYVYVYAKGPLYSDHPPSIKYEHAQKQNHGMFAAGVEVFKVPIHRINKN